MSRTYRRQKGGPSTERDYTWDLRPTGEKKLLRYYTYPGKECKRRLVDVYERQQLEGKELSVALAKYYSDKDQDWTPPRSYSKVMNRKRRAQTRHALIQVMKGARDPEVQLYPVWLRDAGWYYY